MMGRRRCARMAALVETSTRLACSFGLGRRGCVAELVVYAAGRAKICRICNALYDTASSRRVRQVIGTISVRRVRRAGNGAIRAIQGGRALRSPAPDRPPMRRSKVQGNRDFGCCVGRGGRSLPHLFWYSGEGRHQRDLDQAKGERLGTLLWSIRKRGAPPLPGGPFFESIRKGAAVLSPAGSQFTATARMS